MCLLSTSNQVAIDQSGFFIKKTDSQNYVA